MMEPTSPQEYDQQSPRNNYMIPIAIIIAGAMIAGSLFYLKKTQTTQLPNVQGKILEHPEENLVPISASDHILGNPNAPVIMVEYSDTDCPYCQAFHPTLKRIIDQYGKDGKVAWVYRHFAFHPNAPKEAEATECAAELGGNNKFWQYVDILFSKKDFKQDPYKGLDPAQLPIIAGQIGLDKAAFNACLTSGKYALKVAQSYDNAIKAGAQGTPYTILVTRNGKVPINNGAIPYDALKTAIQTLLNETPQ